MRGPEQKLVPLSSFATIQDSVEPRSLNRFNQLNSVKISGIPMAPLDTALKVLEEESAKTLPKGYAIDYAGESRQLRVGGSSFLPTLALALILVFLVLVSCCWGCWKGEKEAARKARLLAAVSHSDA